MSGLDPAVAWLEEQADGYKARLDDPDPCISRAVPTAPVHLAYPGTEQLPLRVDSPVDLAHALCAQRDAQEHCA
ncbi:hypothetical protein [Micrococcus luteus]|uniref:hypothetical protein n=1 Tax=Micrococcus luteus TaxID=1270 RepID=UPI0033192E5D